MRGNLNSLKQFFDHMKDVSFPYVVLRNWDNLPNDCQLGEHSDLDLLVYDFKHFFELFPEAQLTHPAPRVRTKLPVGDSYLYLDVRYVGDDYYPKGFEQAILNTREWNERGFFTPSYEAHTAALAYHAVHHKNYIAPEYRKHLGSSTIEELLAALKQSTIGWVEPKDKTVGRFHGYWKGATAAVERKDGWCQKEQIGYHSYPLIQNEMAILSRLNGLSNHFPACKQEDGKLLIEDCGEALTKDNLPIGWRDQLDSIVTELSKHGVQHRDIRLDNLLVKDGVIKLIDFGWAVDAELGLKFKEIVDNPPSCLGMPNRPSWGFDDEFSMERVKKQIEYMLEEAEELTCA